MTPAMRDSKVGLGVLARRSLTASPAVWPGTGPWPGRHWGSAKFSGVGTEAAEAGKAAALMAVVSAEAPGGVHTTAA